MPQVELGSRFEGIGTFLNLKKAFDDATRQMQWEKEKLMFSGGVDLAKEQMGNKAMLERTLVGAGQLGLQDVGTPPTAPVAPNQADFMKTGVNLNPQQLESIGAYLASGQMGPKGVEFAKRMQEAGGLGNIAGLDRNAFAEAQNQFKGARGAFETAKKNYQPDLQLRPIDTGGATNTVLPKGYTLVRVPGMKPRILKTSSLVGQQGKLSRALTDTEKLIKGQFGGYIPSDANKYNEAFRKYWPNIAKKHSVDMTAEEALGEQSLPSGVSASGMGALDEEEILNAIQEARTAGKDDNFLASRLTAAGLEPAKIQELLTR